LTASAVFAVASTFVLTRSPERADRGWWFALPGAVAVLITMVLGNLAGAVQLIDHAQAPLAAYNWWAPSRVIDGTANEFPFFSFLRGDLHAHVMATPFALVSLALTMQVALTGGRRGTGGRARIAALAELCLGALVVGSLYAINTLDFPTAAVLLAGGVVLWITRSPSRPAQQQSVNGGGGGWRDLVWWLALVAGGLAPFPPFLPHYSPAAPRLALLRGHQPVTRLPARPLAVYAPPPWGGVAALPAR